MRASMNSTAARSTRPPRIVITLADITRATDAVLADDKNELYIAAIRPPAVTRYPQRPAPMTIADRLSRRWTACC